MAALRPLFGHSSQCGPITKADIERASKLRRLLKTDRCAGAMDGGLRTSLVLGIHRQRLICHRSARRDEAQAIGQQT